MIDWVNAEKLPTYRTPGGHRRIKRDDLINFLKRYEMPIHPDLVRDKKKKILVVDDDPITVKVISRNLKKLEEVGEVKTARDGFEAGKQVIAFKPALVILDIVLPIMDGFEVCKNIRSDVMTNGIKILAITAYDTPENKRKILPCGADDYMVKPIKKDELIERVRELLEIEN